MTVVMIVAAAAFDGLVVLVAIEVSCALSLYSALFNIVKLTFILEITVAARGPSLKQGKRGSGASLYVRSF